MKAKYLVYLFLACANLILCSSQVLAQSHQILAARATASYALTPKWKFDLELQHRRQNFIEHKSPFDRPLLNSIRAWVYFAPTKQFSLGVSPIGFFEHHKLIVQGTEINLPATTELRLAASAELKTELLQHLSLQSRSGIEHRNFNNHTHKVRIRQRLQLAYHLNKHLNVQFGDEILLHASPNHSLAYDHNRIFGTCTLKLTPHINLELGYLHITRLAAPTDAPLLVEHNYVLNFTYKIK